MSSLIFIAYTYFHFRELLTNQATGELYKEGEILKHPKLAHTLEIIANEGPNAFYNGSLSENITLDIQEAGKIQYLCELKQFE